MNWETTKMSSITCADSLLEGVESYPIHGQAMSHIEYNFIVRRLAGLRRHWDCLDKAIITAKVLRRGKVVLGSLMLTSSDNSSQYGYYFNPPLEFHAWAQYGYNVIDVALPGTIEKGMVERDEVGPFLVGRSPIVLAGIPPEWAEYKYHQVYEKE